MEENLFDQLIHRVRNARSYAELMELTENQIMAFDQRVKLEDMCAQVFEAILRESNDSTFASMIRRVIRDDPVWLKDVPFDSLVRQELDLRFLLAKLPRMGDEVMA